MANTDKPSGFTPVKMLDGTPWNGALETYYVPSTDNTAIFRGSPVKLAGSADADGIPTVTLATTGDAVEAVMKAIDYQPTNLTTNYRTASTAMYIKCVPVHSVIFEIQENSSAAALAATDVGLNVSYTAESGNTTNGRSTIEIDCDTEQTTNTLAVHILRLAPYPDNAIGDNAKWWVRFNDVQRANQIAGIS